MKIYSFQIRQVVDALEKLDDNDVLFVDIKKSNLLRLQEDERLFSSYFEAYRWIAEKLAQKTDVWLKGLTNHRIPPLPWWGWYKTDGQCGKPSVDYSMQNWTRGFHNDTDETWLLSLEIPDELVLLSDINAFYNCLYGLPCFDYMSEEEEETARAEYAKKTIMFSKTLDKKLGEDLMKMVYDSWENIFIVDGSRRLRNVETGFFLMPEIEEKYDVQACFPFLARRFVIEMECIE